MIGIGPTAATFAQADPRRSGSGRILAIASASDNQRLYLGSYAGVWRSDDGGRNFRQLGRPQPGTFDADVPDAIHAPHILDIAVSPSDPNLVLAAAQRGNYNPSRNGVYRSTDGGDRWTLVLPAFSVGQVVFAPDDGALAFAALGGSVAVSRDGGATWTQAPASSAWHVAIGPLEASGVRRAYAAGSNRIWRSIDSGASWQRDLGANLVRDSRQQLSTFIVANGGGALPAFAMQNFDGFAQSVGTKALAIEPGNPQRVYLATASGTLGPSYFAKKPDKTPVPDGTGCNTTADRLAGEGSLWLGDFTGFDTVGAASWTAVPGPGVYAGGTTPSGQVFVVTHATDTGYLLFFADHAQVHMSKGEPRATAAWHRLDGKDASFDKRKNELFDHLNVHVDPYCVAASIGIDLTLKPVTDVPSPYNLNSELDAHLGGTIWMANDGGVQFSDDGGETWVPSKGIDTVDAINIAGVAGLGPAPALYIGTGDNDSFFSRDGGAKWHDTAIDLGDADAWFADIAQATRVVQFTPRNNKGFHIVTGSGYPDAGNAGAHRNVPGPPNNNVSSGPVLRGYAPLIRTLATEPAPPDGDYLVIGDRSDGTRALWRTLAASSITQPEDWEDPAKAQQIGPPLPTPTVDIVQASGGHASPVFYISDNASLWVLDAGQWRTLVPNMTPGQPTSARRMFVDPFEPRLIYILDNAAFRVSIDGGRTWQLDANLTRAMSGNGKLALTAGGTVRDMLFVRTDRLTRFAFGSAGVMFTIDGIDWRVLHNSIAEGGVPECGFFDGITDPLARTLYVCTEGRGVFRIDNIPAPPPFTSFDGDLMTFAAILHDA